MGANNNLDKAFPGLIADNHGARDFISRSIQDADGIDWGATVWGYLGDEETCYNYYLDTAKVVWDADFITGNTITVTVNGDATAAVPFNVGGHDDTMDDIVTAVTGLTGVDAALDPTDVNNRTLYVRTKGLDNTTTVLVAGGASQAGDTITQQSDQVFIGIAVYIRGYIQVANDGKYYQYDAVSILDRGRIWATLVGTANALDTAYVIAAAGATQGQFTSTVTDNLVINTDFKSNDYTNPTTSDVLAVVEVNGQKKPNVEIVWS